MQFLTRWGRKYALRDLANAYTYVFSTPAGGQYVLPDIADYCRAAEEVVPAGVTDPFEIGRYVGRNDVWRHIQHLLNNTEQELDVYATVKGRPALKFKEVNPQ